MPDPDDHRLQVLIADERDDRLAVITKIVEGLGHEIVARERDVEAIGPLAAVQAPK